MPKSPNGLRGAIGLPRLMMAGRKGEVFLMGREKSSEVVRQIVRLLGQARITYAEADQILDETKLALMEIAKLQPVYQEPS